MVKLWHNLWSFVSNMMIYLSWVLSNLHTHNLGTQDWAKTFLLKVKKISQVRIEEPGRRNTQKGTTRTKGTMKLPVQQHWQSLTHLGTSKRVTCMIATYLLQLTHWHQLSILYSIQNKAEKGLQQSLVRNWSFK